MRDVIVSNGVKAALTCLLLAGGAQAGCAALSSTGATLPKQALSGDVSDPVLYLNAEGDSPVLGFLAQGVPLDVLGPASQGRVPVRVRSAMQVKAFVPEQLLELRAQRHGRIRGTPVYLGPNDPVRVLGDDAERGRLRVSAAPRVAGRALARFEGSYPAVGLAAQPALSAEQLPAGEPYMLPANTTLSLHEQPNGPAVTQLVARAEPVPVAVLNVRGEWYAVRIGEGPYLVGYTNVALQPAAGAAPMAGQARDDERVDGLPKRLAQEEGELRRVAKGAKISFDGRVIAKLDQAGYARVLATYPSGEADALVAVDDKVTVRGLVRAEDLSRVNQ